LDAAYMALLTFSDQALIALAKTWHLSRAYGLQSRRLAGSLASTQADVGQLLADKAFLATTDGDKSEVGRTKMVLKQRSWELANAHKKIEQLESDRHNIEQSMLSMERGRQHEVWSRAESERLLASLKAETILASEQRDEFRRRLSQAKEALHQAQEALTDAKDEVQGAQQRAREIRADGDRRAAALEAKLALAQNQLREQQMPMVPLPGDESGGGSLPFAGNDRSMSDKNLPLSSRRVSGSCHGVRRNQSIVCAKPSAQCSPRTTSMSLVDAVAIKTDSGTATPCTRLSSAGSSAGRVRRTAEKFGGVARQHLRQVGRSVPQNTSNSRVESTSITTTGSSKFSARTMQGEHSSANTGSVRLSARAPQVENGSPRMRSAPLQPLRTQRRAGAGGDDRAVIVKTVE